MLFVNLLAVALAVVLSNELLVWHSYVLYGMQFLTMMPYLVRKAQFLKNVFLPSFFVLFYFLVSLTFGSYLVPREYGEDRRFVVDILSIEHYNVIVPYMLLANVILFMLTIWRLEKLNGARYNYLYRTRWQDESGGRPNLIKTTLYFLAFITVTYLDVFGAFSFQLALLILHFTDPAWRRKWYRFPMYALYLAILVGFSYENKREIVMVLFLFIFLEAYFGRMLLKFNLRRMAAYCMIALCFLSLVLTASILRGYGNFDVSNLVDAFSYIPQYMSSNMFVDGLTDNLELNYSYGSAITSINFGLIGRIDYQYGMSLIKVFFLPIPRDVFPDKPESIMQIFTEEYVPAWVSEGGSLPVMSPAEMFLNFWYFGLLAFGIVWIAIDQIFVTLHRVSPLSFEFHSCTFLIVTVLMLARGSGLEQYVLYYLIGAPVFVLAWILRRFVSGRKLAFVVS